MTSIEAMMIHAKALQQPKRNEALIAACEAYIRLNPPKPTHASMTHEVME